MALKMPASGQLLSLDVIEGLGAIAAAKRLLKTHAAGGAFSTWDASSIFFEMHGLEVSDRPSPRTLVLLYAADLFYRLKWEIIPALEEGKCVVATPYLETGFAFGAVAGLPKRWIAEVFRFAPKAAEKKIELAGEIEPGVRDAVLGDETRLRQVLIVHSPIL